MLSLKLGHVVMEKTGAKVYACYIDMRPNKKDYEEFYHRLLDEGMLFVRGKVAEITDVARTPPEEGKLVVQVEDTLLGKQRRIPVDMVVLMGAIERRRDARETGLKVGISCSIAGWFIERHPKLDPVATITEGVFIAGACQGPKDIPDAVGQGAAAAARVQGMISKGTVMIEPVVATIDEDKCSGCRICNNLCPFSAIEFLPDEAAGAPPGRKVSRVNAVLCKGCGTCVAACPAGAIAGAHFANEQVEAEIEGLLWDVGEAAAGEAEEAPELAQSPT
jgi:heterodisulfide reductase subunit A